MELQKLSRHCKHKYSSMVSLCAFLTRIDSFLIVFKWRGNIQRNVPWRSLPLVFWVQQTVVTLLKDSKLTFFLLLFFFVFVIIWFSLDFLASKFLNHNILLTGNNFLKDEVLSEKIHAHQSTNLQIFLRDKSS